ncbi:MAG: hypothetical protein SFZ24_10775 [Planctomycetota bacterium]|nr:hypothetical protein [Planctomycetota bacterium]
MKTRISSVVIATLLACAGSAAASISYINPYRSVEAWSGQGDTYDWVWTRDEAPFSVTIDRHSDLGATGFIASQQSYLEELQVRYMGTTWAGGGERSGGTWYPVTSRSNMLFEFTLSEASAYEAVMFFSGVGDTTITASLTRGSEVIFDTPGPYLGLLQPGTYQFAAELRSVGVRVFDPDSGYESYFPSTGSFQIWLAIPSPGTALLVGASGLLLLSTRRRA